jgi:hypothetical protein
LNVEGARSNCATAGTMAGDEAVDVVTAAGSADVGAT